MAYFIKTAEALRRLMASESDKAEEVWVNGGVASEGEISRLRNQGWKITAFTSPQESEPGGIALAISEIKEHHPGETIWVEG